MAAANSIPETNAKERRHVIDPKLSGLRLLDHRRQSMKHANSIDRMVAPLNASCNV
jgi:hypothetical protein